MLRRLILAAALVAAAAPAWSQDTPPPAAAAPPPTVAVTTLAAPDAFSTPGRDTGLPQTLWRGASSDLVRTVLPLLATKPLTPAAAGLARRVLATGAAGPLPVPGREGEEEDLTGARVIALMALGDIEAASAILQRGPSGERNSDLSQAAAESALLAGDEARACAVTQALRVGREDIYWLRLRTFCQALAGQTAAAQLTLELAQAHSRDATFGRLMTAKLGGGSAGAASLRNGLDLALSRSLGLDLKAAKASPAVAAALGTAVAPVEPVIAPDLMVFANMISGREEAGRTFIDTANPKTAPRMEAATLLAMPSIENWDFAVPEGKAPLGRNLALQAAADDKHMGAVALLALLTSVEAGAAGPATGDRVRIVLALRAVGLTEDARAFALEGLAALK